MFTLSLCRSLTALTLSLLFAFSSTVYAQSGKHTPASPPSSIHFAGVNYHLISEEIEEHFRDAYYYQPKEPISHLQELVLNWWSSENIGDSYDEKSCPRLKDEPIFHSRGIGWFITYMACDEMYDLEDKETGVIHIRVDNQREEIFLAYYIADSDDLGQFVKFTISRYIPVPIPHYEHIFGLLNYTYTITEYGPQEQAVASLLDKLNEEGEQWMQAVSSVPVPQFILDRAKNYKDCYTFYGDEKDRYCPG